MVAILAGLAMGGGMAGVTGAIQPILEVTQQNAFKLWPNRIMPEGVLVDLRIKDLITSEVFYEMMSRLGYSEDKAGDVLQSSRLYLNGLDIVSLARREKIEEGTLYERMDEIGVSAAKTKELFALSEPIPSVDDVIRFAVREVYSPKIAEAFGQFEGFEDVYEEAGNDLRAIGVSKENFSKYWASHWMLPSVQQGFEMLHRGVIDQKTLDMLFKAADVMPAWRGNLQDIAYHPYTRVDVRRMHKSGVLTEGELLRAYLDLGYDDAKATKMMEWTIAYNYDSPEIEKNEAEKRRDKLKDLSKADIMKAYSYKMIDEDGAIAALFALGYDNEEAQYYIDAADFGEDEDITQLNLKLLHDGYIKGVFSRNDIIDRTAKLGIRTGYLNVLLKIWDIELEIKAKIPSKAEVLGFIKRGIITKEEGREELSAMGYSEKYIGWYFKAGEIEGVKI